MVRGLYTAAAGMLVELTRQDVIANNLANVNTTGFKKDTTVIRAFPQMLINRTNDTFRRTSWGEVDLRPVIGTLGTGAQVEEIVTLFTPGAIKPTDNKLDLAISGEGFFSLQTPQGIRYTRDGTFSRDRAGQLITQEGYLVLGQRGPIRIAGGSIVVDEGGRVVVDGVVVDTLQITSFANLSSLQKIGDNLYFAPPAAGGAPSNRFEIKQGYLEVSNVNTVKEMVDMITVMRSYEANQRLIRAQDETLDRVINEVGRAV